SLLRRIGVGDSGKGLDQADNGTEQAKQGGNVGERGNVAATRFEARQHFHEAFFHRQLDVVVATADVRALETVGNHATDAGRCVLDTYHGLAELALRDHRVDLVPALLVACLCCLQIDNALQHYDEADCQHHQNRVHVGAPVLDKA